MCVCVCVCVRACAYLYMYMGGGGGEPAGADRHTHTGVLNGVSTGWCPKCDTVARGDVFVRQLHVACVRLHEPGWVLNASRVVFQ